MNEKGETQEQVINKADSDANKAITDFNSLKFPTEEQYNKTKALSERTGYVRDSIGKANVKMDKLFAAQDQKRKEILSGKY